MDRRHRGTSGKRRGRRSAKTRESLGLNVVLVGQDGILRGGWQPPLFEIGRSFRSCRCFGETISYLFFGPSDKYQGRLITVVRSFPLNSSSAFKTCDRLLCNRK